MANGRPVANCADETVKRKKRMLAEAKTVDKQLLSCAEELTCRKNVPDIFVKKTNIIARFNISGSGCRLA